jgi:hypothetical protein
VLLGGLVGDAEGVTNSYATGAVSAQVAEFANTGGLVSDGCCIANSYSIGEVSGSNVGNFLPGGFIAKSVAPYDFQSAYWDIQTSGQKKGCGLGHCSGVVGLSDEQLKGGLPAGFDPAIWGQKKSINNGYPYLLANPPPQ